MITHSYAGPTNSRRTTGSVPFAPCTKITVSHPTEPERCTATVMSVSAIDIEIALHNGHRFPTYLRVGELVIVTSAPPSPQSFVARVSVDGGTHARLQIVDRSDDVDTRRFPRANVMVPSRIFVGGEPPIPGVLRDVSVGGCGLLVIDPIPLGTRLTVEARLAHVPIDPKMVTVRCVEHDGMHLVGASFEPLSTANHRAIATFVREQRHLDRR